MTGLGFGLSAEPWIKWTWFLISCGAFLAVYYVIRGPLREENAKEREDVRHAFNRNAAFLSVFWFIYPIILLMGTDGLRLIDPVLTTASIAILDLVAKVVYGLMATVARAKIVDRDLAETRTGAATPLRSAQGPPPRRRCARGARGASSRRRRPCSSGPASDAPSSPRRGCRPDRAGSPCSAS